MLASRPEWVKTIRHMITMFSNASTQEVVSHQDVTDESKQYPGADDVELAFLSCRSSLTSSLGDLTGNVKTFRSAPSSK